MARPWGIWSADLRQETAMEVGQGTEDEARAGAAQRNETARRMDMRGVVYVALPPGRKPRAGDIDAPLLEWALREDAPAPSVPPEPAPDHLSALSDELLALCMPGPSYGPDRARWETNVNGVIARILRLGQAIGWDKAAAASEPARAPEPAGPALIGPEESERLSAQLAEAELIITRVQRGMTRDDYSRRVVLAELSRASGVLDTAAGALREIT